ncbi:O-methyltransferase [Acinetobacter lanii]|uniref:O-methyltransferase n=1 Tax=Acinetobacter lanii TaxID=2715163 RepID=A0A6G8S4W0_9GAMM|nr:O-methyltransferase [Acinetobacter lanii]
MRMDAMQLKRLEQLYQDFVAHDAEQHDRIARYRNIEPESAQYLSMLVSIQQSKTILEIGTSTGYSTLWLADAVQKTQGHLTTLEIDAVRSQQAQQYIEEFGLSESVDFWVGDAKAFLVSNHEQYDLILLDAERDAYVEYWVYLQNMLATDHGVLVVDNVISHAHEVEKFMAKVKNDHRFTSMIIPLGAGLLLIKRI